MGACGSTPKMNAQFNGLSITIKAVPPALAEAGALVEEDEVKELLESISTRRRALLDLVARMKTHPDGSDAFRVATESRTEENEKRAFDLCIASTTLLKDCRAAVMDLVESTGELIFRLIPSASQEPASVFEHMSSRPVTDVVIPYLISASSALFSFDMAKVNRAPLLNDISFFRRLLMTRELPPGHPLHQDVFEAPDLSLWLGSNLSAVGELVGTMAEYARQNALLARGLYSVANILIVSCSNGNFGSGDEHSPMPFSAFFFTELVVAMTDGVTPAFNIDSEVSGAYLVSLFQKQSSQSDVLTRILKFCAPNAMQSTYPRICAAFDSV